MSTFLPSPRGYATLRMPTADPRGRGSLCSSSIRRDAATELEAAAASRKWVTRAVIAGGGFVPFALLRLKGKPFSPSRLYQPASESERERERQQSESQGCPFSTRLRYS